MTLCMIIKTVYLKFLGKKRDRYIKGLISKGLKLGRNVEIIDSFFFDPSHCFLISIGDNCTICPNVRLIAHDASSKKHLDYTKIGKIDIRENCFIGDSTIVLPGVRIGPNVIIGAGSVVTKDIPPGIVAAGNPAREIESLERYLRKIDEIKRGKGVFSKEYYIERLDEAKRKEMLSSIGESIGLII